MVDGWTEKDEEDEEEKEKEKEEEEDKGEEDLQSPTTHQAKSHCPCGTKQRATAPVARSGVLPQAAWIISMWLLGLTPQPPRGPGPPKLGKSMMGIAFGSAPWTVFLLPFFRSKIRAFFGAAFSLFLKIM